MARVSLYLFTWVLCILVFLGFLISWVVGQKGSLGISPSGETERHPLSILKCWWPFSRTVRLLQSYMRYAKLLMKAMRCHHFPADLDDLRGHRGTTVSHRSVPKLALNWWALTLLAAVEGSCRLAAGLLARAVLSGLWYFCHSHGHQELHGLMGSPLRAVLLLLAPARWLCAVWKIWVDYLK